MTTIKKIQKTFDGADRSQMWVPVQDDRHGNEDYYFNVFYVCPNDKIVEFEISHLHGRRRYLTSTTNYLRDAWIAVAHAAASSNYWLGYNYRYRHEYSAWIKYPFSNIAYNSGTFSWPTVYDDPDYHIKVGTQKLKLLPGDKLVAFVRSDAQWGTTAYTHEPLDNHFTFDAVAYEEDFSGNVANPNFGDTIFGYNIVDPTTGVIYVYGNVTAKYPTGTDIRIQNLSLTGQSLSKTVSVAPTYLGTTTNLTEIRFSGIISRPVLYRDYLDAREHGNFITASNNSGYASYTLDGINFRLDPGETVYMGTKTNELRSYYPLRIKNVSGTTITTYDTFLYAAFPLENCTIDIA